MIEAMACGTPVIAFRRGSTPEVIDEGVSGFLVDSVDEAVAAIGRLGEFDRLRARRRFEQRFTVERVAREYVDIYRRRLGVPRPKGETAHRRFTLGDSLNLADGPLASTQSPS
jgi:glycosyltransferase involved in cell wall biosynthesis